jgi:shikimate kinase
MKIYLVGLPGSGKSLLGRKLSKSINLPFIDLDAELEKHEGLKVAKIFAGKGQDYFRTLEADMLRKLSDEKEFVMATGGGAPCFHNNMEFINQTGTSIFLNTPIATIASRISPKEKKTRPLLEDVPDDQLEQKLEELLKRRLTYYQQAHFTIDGGTATDWDILQLLYTKKP